jgi:hypothetical protein
LNLLRCAFLASVLTLSFAACAPSDGDSGDSSNDGGTSPGGSGGAAPSGGQSGTGASATGGASGATTGGVSGAGFGGDAGGPPSGGASGTAGAAAGGTAGLAGGSGGSGVSGTGGGGDAGAPPGGAGGSGPGAYTGTIIIQDDFESATAGAQPDMTKWEQYQSFESMLAPSVDTARKNRGQNSARVQSTSSGRGSFLVPRTGILPVTGNSFYVRVFMNWEKATSAISGHSGFIVGSAARENNGTECRLGISSKGPNNVPRLDFNLIGATDGMGGEVTRYSNGYTDGGNPADFPGMGFQFAADRWYCVEAYYGGMPNMSELRVWVDGTEIMEMHVTDFRGNMSGSPRVNWAPTYSFLKIGAQDYDANLGRIWYDDVFVGTAPVGCER